jgi:hypothetical protein
VAVSFLIALITAGWRVAVAVAVCLVRSGGPPALIAFRVAAAPGSV